MIQYIRPFLVQSGDSIIAKDIFIYKLKKGCQ